MTRPQSPAFRSGDLVEERGGGVYGQIVGAGKYPGEWRVLCSDGRELTCLEENLSYRSEEPRSAPRLEGAPARSQDRE